MIISALTRASRPGEQVRAGVPPGGTGRLQGTAASSAGSAERAAEILDRPVPISGLTIPDRIAMAPMARYFSLDAISGEDVVRTTRAAPRQAPA